MNAWAIIYVIACLIQSNAIPAHDDPVPMSVIALERLDWQAEAVKQWQRTMKGIKPKMKRRRKH